MTEVHEHDHHDHQNPEKSKYDEALSMYQTDYNDEEINTAVKNLLASKIAENKTTAVKKFLLSCVDLTSLHTEDTDESILKMTEKVNNFVEDYGELVNVAGICVYPRFTKLVHDSIEADDVNVVVVCGDFPHSQTYTEVKVAETALCIADGADEIDIVLPVGKFFSGDYEGTCDEIEELKETCSEHRMKVILETGALKTATNIKKASILAMYSGADFIKTSTGKQMPAATPEAFYVMCKAIKEYFDNTGRKVGIKAAGGINTVDEAVGYYTIAKEILGKEWLDRNYFRLGTSRLANQLLSEIVGKDVKYF